MKKILLIERAPRFSPNSVEKDRLILHAVGGLLQGNHAVEYVNEEALTPPLAADCILSMGRLPQTLAILLQKESEGTRVLNPASSLMKATRSYIDRTLRTQGLPLAPLKGDHGYWLKRGDAAAQTRDDVQYATSEADCQRLLAKFHSRGINDVVVTAHVVGDLVKFYGVMGTGFFRCFYPTDDGDTKFSDEHINGKAQHFAFNKSAAQAVAERMATLLQIPIYGGDMIVKADGSLAVIDFNDWPSFSRCRSEATEAISQLVSKN